MRADNDTFSLAARLHFRRANHKKMGNLEEICYFLRIRVAAETTGIHRAALLEWRNLRRRAKKIVRRSRILLGASVASDCIHLAADRQRPGNTALAATADYHAAGNIQSSDCFTTNTTNTTHTTHNTQQTQQTQQTQPHNKEKPHKNRGSFFLFSFLRVGEKAPA